MTLFIHDFVQAALPWVAMAVALAVVAVYSDEAKEEKKIEK